MEWIWIIVAFVAGLFGAITGIGLGSYSLRRLVREVQYGHAELEDRFIRHVRRGAALDRWDAGPGPEEAKEELKAGFLHPAEFARRKSERRMRRGAEDREVPPEAG